MQGLRRKHDINIEIFTPKEGDGTKLLKEYVDNVFVDGRIIPFHNSTVSGLSIKKIIKGLAGIVAAPFFCLSILKRNPDIVHINSSSLIFYGVFIKIFNKNIKLFCHLREPLLENFLSKFFIFLIQRHCDKIIGITDYELSSFSRSDKVIVIENPIFSLGFNPVSKKEFPKLKKFLYLSRFTKQNGIDDFIKLANYAEKEKYPFRFLAVGAKNIADYADSSNNLRVIKETNEISEHLADCDFLIAPFKTPHFSRSVIEAMFYGLIPIVYDVAPLNKLIINNENGFIVKDLKELRELIIEINDAKNYDLQKIRDNCINYANGNYNTSDIVQKFYEII